IGWDDKHRKKLLHLVLSNDRFQIGDLNPGKNQEPIVAQDQMQQFFPMLVIPADPMVAWRQSPGGRGGKQQTSESLLARLGDDKVAQMGTDRLAVAQI